MRRGLGRSIYHSHNNHLSLRGWNSFTSTLLDKREAYSLSRSSIVPSLCDESETSQLIWLLTFAITSSDLLHYPPNLWQCVWIKCLVPICLLVKWVIKYFKEQSMHHNDLERFCRVKKALVYFWWIFQQVLFLCVSIN